MPCAKTNPTATITAPKLFRIWISLRESLGADEQPFLNAAEDAVATHPRDSSSPGVAVSTVVVALSALALAFVWFSRERALRRPLTRERVGP
jgi:hypothetical protein